MPAIAEYHVRAVHCDHRESDEEVYRALKRATEPLEESWDKIRQAQRITIKFNQVFPPEWRHTSMACSRSWWKQGGPGYLAPAAREQPRCRDSLPGNLARGPPCRGTA